MHQIWFVFRYVSAVFPTGTEELRGDEVDTIIKFKNALGIDDPDAADMHMEVTWSIYLILYLSITILLAVVGLQS